MTNLIIHPEVEGDLQQARDYYSQIDRKLGLRFLDDVDAGD